MPTVSGAGEKKQLGRILLQQQLVSASKLDALLDTQRAKPGTRLASLTAASGEVSQLDLLRALSEQHGVPGLDVAQVVVPLEHLALVPREIAKQHAILPILVRDDELFLAMADPSDKRAIDEIEFVTGRRISPYVALHDPLQALIDVCYREAERGAARYVGPEVPHDYLVQAGLAEAAPAPTPAAGDRADASGVSPSPRAGAPHAPTGADDLAETSFANLMDDGPESLPPLDPVFESRVGPLPMRPPSLDRAGARVLLLDADEAVRRAFARALGDRGYEVVEAATGQDGIAALRASPADLLVIDDALPDVHALDLCRRIKGSSRFGKTPIVVVSARHRGWRVAADLRETYGVAAFLEKPLRMAEVSTTVARCLAGLEAEGSDPDAISDEAAASLAAGMQAFKSGDLPRALTELERGLTFDPRAFRLHYHLGLLYGRDDATVFEAIAALETAVTLAPRHFGALKNLAVLHQRVGHKHQSIDMWERALGCSPDDETRRGIQAHILSLL
jgi:DNA-binding response OmpR family regulator